MYTKLHFLICRSMQFFFASYVKSLSFDYFHIKPDLCWSFFLDKDFVYLADFIQKDVSKLKVIGSQSEENVFGNLFFDTGLNIAEKYIPVAFHDDTKQKYKTKLPNSLPEFNFPTDRLDDIDEIFTEVVRMDQNQLIKRSFNFRYYVRGYFKLIYSFVNKKYKLQEYKMTPPPKPPHFEFIGTLPRFYPVNDTLTAPLPQNRKYDFETFFTIIPTAPYFGGLISKIFFTTDLLLNFYKKTGEKPDILVGDRHHLTFYKIPFGERQANITITEQNLFTIDNFQKNKSSWCFFRQLWKKQISSYSRFEHEINFWNFTHNSFSEELISFFYNNTFSVNYMDPHIGRVVNHYKRLLDIEFTENKYLEEVYDSLFPWVEHVETMWKLIIEALDDFKGFKIFHWLKHTKTSKAYDAQTLIQPIFARIKSIPKYSPYFYTYYYPILDLSQTTVLPQTSFRVPHFKRKILITQEFAHNFHIQSFFRFARVLIRRGFKKRALRMLKYCLIHLKKKYACYSSSNMLLGAVKKATPDLIQMPFLKGKVKENSIIPARSIRRFSEGVRNLYDCARFRRIHLDWGLDFFVGKKFEHVLAEEIIDVVKDKYDCTTLRRMRHNLVELTQLGRSRYTRKVGVVKYTPYDFAEESLQYIFSEKPKKYEIAEERGVNFLPMKKQPVTAPSPFEFIWKNKVKLRRLLYSKPTLRQRYEKQYGFNKIQQFSKQKVQLKKNKFISKIKKKHSS